MVKYTKAQKAAYAKRMAKKNGKSKAKSKAFNVPRKSNLEVKFVTLSEQTATLQALGGSGNNGPENSLLLFPELFHRDSQVLERGVAADEYIGAWCTPAYKLNHKIELAFDDIVSTHADSAQGFNVDIYELIVKISGNKADLTRASFSDWAASVSALCKRELFESNFSSDFLSYEQRNRNITVVSKKRVNTNQLRKYVVPNTDTTQICAPPKRITISHSVPKVGRKQRITQLDAPTVTSGILNDVHIPLVMLCCNEMTVNTGSIAVRHGSRFYFQDS